ncbi:HNH endonuclease [Lentzea sp. NPDC102401]|uniref:HNH endonuclease n=1 Tax=Lentzea sp. NPDC102401 TaxID=3364128 RepID=UPI003800FCB8
MLSLVSSGRDAVADLSLAISTSSDPVKGILQGIKGLLEDAYPKYIAAMNDVGTCCAIGLSVPQADALEGTYEALRTRASLKPIRDELLSLVDRLGSYCPLCGIEQASTLDHYVPKSAFPEFAIFHFNLIPCCSRCNQFKGKTSYGTVEDNLFIHPYFHALDAYELLKAVLLQRSGTFYVEFRLDRPEGVPDLLFEKIENQVNRIRLLQRILGPAGTELASHAQNCELFAASGGTAMVVESCIRQADYWKGAAGTNHWRTALYKAMSLSEDFCSGGFLSFVPKYDADSNGLISYGS